MTSPKDALELAKAMVIYESPQSKDFYYHTPQVKQIARALISAHEKLEKAKVALAEAHDEILEIKNGRQDRRGLKEAVASLFEALKEIEG